MMMFSDWDRQQGLAQTQQQQMENEAVYCPKCGSEWFEHISVSKYQANHFLILGQHVPPVKGSLPYIVLKCIRCTNLLEPRLTHAIRDLAGRDYGTFLDTIEGKGDSREKEEKKGELVYLTNEQMDVLRKLIADSVAPPVQIAEPTPVIEPPKKKKVIKGEEV